FALNPRNPDWANQPGDGLRWHSRALESRSKARGLTLGADEPQPRKVIALQDGLTQRKVQRMTVRHNKKIGARRRVRHGRERVSIASDPHTFEFQRGKQLGTRIDPRKPQRKLR